MSKQKKTKVNNRRKISKTEKQTESCENSAVNKYFALVKKQTSLLNCTKKNCKANLYRHKYMLYARYQLCSVAHLFLTNCEQWMMCLRSSCHVLNTAINYIRTETLTAVAATTDECKCQAGFISNKIATRTT